MRTIAISVVSVALVGAARAQGTVTPPALYPDLGANVINFDGNGNRIASLGQLELRSIGNGLYRSVFTASLVGHTDTELVSGTVDLTTAPPTWTPNNDVSALNVASSSTDEFQGSMSADGLVIVWDNYLFASYPNASGGAFVCRRTSTSVPFQVANVRALTGIAYGPLGVFDPHIGAEHANGHVLLFFDDSGSNISKGDLDPTTGAVTSITTAVLRSTRPAVAWVHSPFVQRDSAGNPRALSFAEYRRLGGSPSDGWWTDSVQNNGSPAVILPTTGLPYIPYYNNPAVIGGTWIYATYVPGYIDPTLYEAVAVADADLSSGSGSIVAFAPIRPRLQSSFLSIVGLGVPAPPYSIPPVLGNILVTPVIGILALTLNDPYTGLAEWQFHNLPTGFGGPYTMQVVTLDTGTNRIIAGNSATLVLP